MGTDASGGYSLSILSTIQHASIASKMIAVQAAANSDKQSGRFTNQRLSIATLLYLATLGGAHLCCLQDRIGSFAKGKAFDALLVSVRHETGNPAVWGYNPRRDVTEDTSQDADKSLKEWLERFLFCGDDRNIKRVIVQGRMIGGQEYQH